MAGITSGKPTNLYEFVDGTVGYFSLGAPPWQEAGDLVGTDLEKGRRILEERGTPGGKAG